MAVRKRYLPEGWYPADRSGALADIDNCFSRANEMGLVASNPNSVAVMAPHASWFYSGTLAVASIASLSREAETVIVFGGHLPSNAVPLLAEEDQFETPLGRISSDAELTDVLYRNYDFDRDLYTDNTVEIQLPIVKRFFPDARIVWMRMPASMESFSIGQSLGSAARKMGRRAVAVGSTDLTHYGPNYGFTPKGLGPAALDWVRGENDRRFIDAALASDPERTLARASNEGSACSPGAVLAAIGFASAFGSCDARLIAYATSADAHPSASFVGYASISWEPRSPS